MWLKYFKRVPYWSIFLHSFHVYWISWTCLLLMDYGEKNNKFDIHVIVMKKYILEIQVNIWPSQTNNRENTALKPMSRGAPVSSSFHHISFRYPTHIAYALHFNYLLRDLPRLSSSQSLCLCTRTYLLRLSCWLGIIVIENYNYNLIYNYVNYNIYYNYVNSNFNYNYVNYNLYYNYVNNIFNYNYVIKNCN